MSTPTLPVVDPSSLLRAGITRCKKHRRDLVNAWSDNVDYARGKPFEEESDDDRVYVNTDNTMAKRKAAQIASQCPEARLTAKHARVLPVLAQFAKRLNDEIRRANIGDALFESAKDVINAAGIAVVFCGYQARTKLVTVPKADPMTLTPDQQNGLAAAQQIEDEAQAGELYAAYGIPVMQVPKVLSSRLFGRRISPSDFLWPLEFERSNFDEAPWLGHSDRMYWAEAQDEFKLTDEQKPLVCSQRSVADDPTLRDDGASDAQTSPDEVVEYDELFYWRAKYDPSEPYLDAIWRIVFVKGIEKPVIHEQWTGQKFLPAAQGYVGACKFPLRVLTLDYISDDAIPPSDSAIARPQVNELIRSRTQMVQQRERSQPYRWHDVNRVDALTNVNLMRGTIQGSIPVKGNGNSIIGEVARANYPSENFEFDRTIKNDIGESWGMDSNQLGQFAMGRRTAKEAEVVQANFSTLAGFQRARVAAFFCGIAEVFAGLLCVHGQDLPQPPTANENEPPLDVSQLSSLFDYSVLPDTTVLTDANQQAASLLDLLDMVGKSGFVNPEPIIRKIILLKGQDPNEIMIKPEPKPEEPPSIAYSFKGEDLINPVALGVLVEKGQAPSPQAMQAAIKILQMAGIPITLPPPAAPDPMAAPPGAPGAPAPDGGMPPAAPLPPADARPDWTAMPSITKRTE